MCYVAFYMVIMIRDSNIVYAIGLTEGNDLRDGIVGRFLAMAGVQVQVALKPYAAGKGRYGGHLT